MSIERTLAAEREAHFDGDAWRSRCAAQDYVRRPVLPPRVLQDPATCQHMSLASYADRVVCCQCEAVVKRYA